MKSNVKSFIVNRKNYQCCFKSSFKYLKIYSFYTIELHYKKIQCYENFDIV